MWRFVNADLRTQLNAELTRLARGDRAALTPLFQQLKPLVTTFCLRWLRHDADAEEAAGQALVQLFSQVHAFDPKRDALAWALELAAWQCRTIQKRRSRDVTVALERAAGEAADTPDPERATEVMELREAVHAVAAQLSATDRDEFTRALNEQLAGDAAARKRRQRALDRFKTLWRSLHADE